jgi:phage-related protein
MSRLPWEGVQQAVASISSNVANSFQDVAQCVGQHVQPWQRSMDTLLQGIQQQLGQHFQQQQQQLLQRQQRNFLAPLAVSDKAMRSTSHPLYACMHGP